jgi:hypothetical protein
MGHPVSKLQPGARSKVGRGNRNIKVRTLLVIAYGPRAKKDHLLDLADFKQQLKASPRTLRQDDVAVMT